MKLNKRQFCTAVKNYQTMLEEENQICDILNISPEWKGAEWIENYYDLLTELCELEEDPYIGTDLDWFCYETDFGNNDDYCKVFDHETSRTWHIKTPEILYDFIMREDQGIDRRGSLYYLFFKFDFFKKL